MYWLHDGIIEYGFLSKHNVKMAGHWQFFFCLCVLMDQDRVKVHKHAKENNAIMKQSLPKKLANSKLRIYCIEKYHILFSCGT